MVKQPRSSSSAAKSSSPGAGQKLTLQQRMDKAGEIDWVPVDLNTTTFNIVGLNRNDGYAVVDLPRGSQLGAIFLTILPVTFLQKVWDSFPLHNWIYGSGKYSGTICEGKFNKKVILTYLAVYVRIVGKQNKPMENTRNPHALRKSISMCLNELKQTLPQDRHNDVVGLHTLEKLFGRFHITADHWQELSLNHLLTPLKSTGKFVVGDEKLLHFTGDSAYIRLIPSKPDRIGLWFFELVCMLDEKTPYLLHARLQNSVAALGEKIPVNAVIKDWSKVVLHYKVKNKDSGPILVFDSHYTDSEGRKYMNESGVRYIGACNFARFGLLVDILREI